MRHDSRTLETYDRMKPLARLHLCAIQRRCLKKCLRCLRNVRSVSHRFRRATSCLCTFVNAMAWMHRVRTGRWTRLGRRYLRTSTNRWPMSPVWLHPSAVVSYSSMCNWRSHKRQFRPTFYNLPLFLIVGRPTTLWMLAFCGGWKRVESGLRPMTNCCATSVCDWPMAQWYDRPRQRISACASEGNITTPARSWQFRSSRTR